MFSLYIKKKGHNSIVSKTVLCIIPVTMIFVSALALISVVSFVPASADTVEELKTGPNPTDSIAQDDAMHLQSADSKHHNSSDIPSDITNQSPTPTDPTLSPPTNGWSNFGNIETERWYANGTMVTSQEFTDPATGQRYYANTDGSIAHDVDMQLPSNGTTITVRFAHDGHLVTGMDCKDGAWYFFNLEDGSMAYGERYINYDKEHTGWYYFDPYTGKMAHGNVYIPHWGKWCWTGADGKLQGDTPGKIGWQNPAAFYQVSSKNVNKVGQGMFSYIQPSRLSVDGSRADAINIFVNTALSYLGSPYKWNYALWPGGGSDCAGLVISSMESVGMQTPYNAYDHRFQAWQDHDANNMWNDPRIMKVAVADRRRGDLVFYPGHVAIYLGNDTIINAYPPHVEYDSIWRWSVRGIGRLFI